MKKTFWDLSDKAEPASTDGLFDGIKVERVPKKTVSAIENKVVGGKKSAQKNGVWERRLAASALAVCLLAVVVSVGYYELNGGTGTNGLPSVPSGSDVWVSAMGDWPYYKNAMEIADAAKNVFVGEVTGISFEIYDIRTGKPDRSYDPDNFTRLLNTVYTVKVKKSYKGENGETEIVVRVGGTVGYKEDEQKALLREAGLSDGSKIQVVAGNFPDLKVGGSYLFCVVKRGDCCRIINPEQFAFDVSSATAQAIVRHAG